MLITQALELTIYQYLYQLVPCAGWHTGILKSSCNQSSE
jgi:hypothetical protein